MKSLSVVVLALTVIATAVEAKTTKKRGLEETALGYSQQNVFPLGGPLDLGILEGIELKSYEALGQSSSYSLGLAEGGFSHIPYSLGSIGGNAELQLTNGDLHNSGLSLSGSYASGYGLGLINSRPGQTASPVSIPQPVAPAITIPKSPPVPANSAIQGVPNAPQLPALIPAPVPRPAQLPSAPYTNTQSGAATLGSGSLGYANLGNGLFALGSGSLGYSSPNPQQPQPQLYNDYSANLQSGFGGLYGGSQLAYGTQQLAYVGQDSGVNSGYGGYSLTGGRLNGGHLNAGLLGSNLNYGGGIGILGYGTLPYTSISKGY